MTKIQVQEKSSGMENTDTEIVQPERRQKSALIVGVFGVLVVGLIIGATVVGVLVGKNMMKGVYEEAWVTYHLDSGSDVNERYIIDGSEVVIIKPGEISLVYDYSKRHVVLQFDGMRRNVSNACACMVHELFVKQNTSLDGIVDFMKAKDIEVSGNFLISETELRITGEMLDLSNLSKRSREMCHGCEILEATVHMLKEIGDLEVKRRRRDESCVVFYCAATVDQPTTTCNRTRSGLDGSGGEILKCLQ